MSSHHIVREKQEPALLALALDNFDDELLGQLLEWSPTVITTPHTAEQINAYGIKVDLIIAAAPDEALQSDVKLINPGQSTNIEAALNYLIASGYSSVNIITDEFELDSFLVYADKINLVIFCGDKKIFPVSSGFSKWKPAGESIQLMEDVPGLTTSGLTLADKREYLTTADGFYTLHFSQPFVFIAEKV